MSFKNILVTGGCGFIGANLIRLLLDKGYEIKVVDNLCAGNRDYLDGLDHEFFNADIRDDAGLAEAFKNTDAIIHLAAFGNVVDSVKEPSDNFDVNAFGTFNVLNQATRAGVSKVVFASTGGALMGNTTPPVNEKSLPKPISPYGASKMVGEAYCNAFAGSYDIDTVACRFANVYGPWSAHKKGVITKYINWLRNGEPLVIFGDGSATRDYLHVLDLCDGVIRALEHDAKGAEVFHLGTGVGTSLLELSNCMLEIAGKSDVPIEFLDKRRGEVDETFSGFDKAKEVLGFQPRYDLKTGMQETWDWYCKYV